MKNLHFLFVKYIFIYLFIQINRSKIHVIFYLCFKFKPFRVSSNYSLQILLVSRYLLKKKIVYEYFCFIPLSWNYSTLHAQCITVYYARNQWNLNLKRKNTLMIYFTLSQQNIVQCTQFFFNSNNSDSVNNCSGYIIFINHNNLIHIYYLPNNECISFYLI